MGCPANKWYAKKAVLEGHSNVGDSGWILYTELTTRHDGVRMRELPRKNTRPSEEYLASLQSEPLTVLTLGRPDPFLMSLLGHCQDSSCRVSWV